MALPGVAIASGLRLSTWSPRKKTDGDPVAALNARTVPYQYPVRHIADCTFPWWPESFLHNRFGESIPPNSSSFGRHRKNSHYHAIWAF